MRERMLIAGAAGMEMEMRMRVLPEAGAQVVEDGRVQYAAGGSGAMAALALARLGATPLLVARLGADLHGQRLSRLYRETGVDVTYVTVDRRQPTGLRVVIREDSGDCRTVEYPGANAALTLSDAERALEGGGAEAVCASLSLPSHMTAGLSRLATSVGLPLFLDGDGMDSETLLSALSRAEVFCQSDKDVYALTGTYPAGADSCLKAAVELQKRIAARYYVIKLEERGLFVYDGVICRVVPTLSGRLAARGGTCETLLPVLALEYLRNGRDVINAGKYALAYHALLLKNAADPHYFPGADEIRAFADQH